MKTASAKPSTKAGPVQLKDITPKKETKGGTFDSRAGVGILKSVDGGQTWLS